LDATLKCESCGRRYPQYMSIPDLTFFPERDDSDSFNQKQAEYERNLHDTEAQSTYDDLVVRRYGDKTELIAEHWASRLQPPVLDYGCGTGQISRVLRRRFEEVFAFDISPISTVRNARENGVLAVIANCFRLPFRDGAFESSCANGVLHHLVDLRSAIQEMARVTRNSIAISEPSPLGLYGLGSKSLCLIKASIKKVLIALRLRRQGAGGSESKYERPLAPEEVAVHLREAGFEIVHLRFWTNLPWSGRSAMKRFLTRKLASKRAGTHWELIAQRVQPGHADGNGSGTCRAR